MWRRWDLNPCKSKQESEYCTRQINKIQTFRDGLILEARGDIYLIEMTVVTNDLDYITVGQTRPIYIKNYLNSMYLSFDEKRR